MTMKQWWVITFKVTGGERTTVHDSVVAAETEFAAKSSWADDLSAEHPDWKADENWGFSLPCNCVNPEDLLKCDGHGEITFRKIQGPFANEDRAWERCAEYPYQMRGWARRLGIY